MVAGKVEPGLGSFHLLAPEEGLPFKPKYWANFFKCIFCFILLFTSSSPCRKDQFAVFYEPLVFYLFPENLKVSKRNYEILTNWEIKVVTSRCHGSKISEKVRRHIGKREEPGDEVEIEVLSAAISTAFFSVKKKTGNCIFFVPRFEVLSTLFSCPTNSKGIWEINFNYPQKFSF